MRLPEEAEGLWLEGILKCQQEGKLAGTTNHISQAQKGWVVLDVGQ